MLNLIRYKGSAAFALGVVLILALGLNGQTLHLNEVMLLNASTIFDDDGDSENWLEIYNSGATPANLVGYGLSDDLNEPFKWIFPHYIIPSQGFALVWASGKDRVDPSEPLHLNFSLDNDGGLVFLTSSQGVILDLLVTIESPADISFGRLPDGGNAIGLFDLASPAATNEGALQFVGSSSPPLFSEPSGFYTAEFQLELSATDPDDIVVYTLDGSEPDTANIDGTSFMYKNDYVFYPGPLGDSLYGLMKSHMYLDPLTIYDRSAEPDVTSQKASTWSSFGAYFPDSPSSKAFVVRARTYSSGLLPSPIESRTYFVHPEGANRYHLPVVSLALPEQDLYGYYDGIIVPGYIYDQYRISYPDSVWQDYPRIRSNNFGQRGQEWERKAAFTFFVPGEEEAILDQTVGVRMHGAASRRWPRKSLRLYARDEYGTDGIDYPFFSTLDQQSYKRLILHNGGNDEFRSNMRDAVSQSIVRPMDIMTINYTPAITFINGEFYGLNNIREHYGHDLFEYRFGIPEESFEAVKSGRLEAGDSLVYSMLTDFVANNSLESDEQFQVFASMLDPISMRELFVANIYLGNIDWLPNNTYLWRSIDIGILGDTLFRFSLIDLDKSMGFLTGVESISDNRLDFILNVQDNGREQLDWFRAAIENETFKTNFINRFADVMNTYFLPERCRDIVSSFIEAYTPDYQEHLDRWSRPGTMENWEANTNVLDTFLLMRTTFQREHLQEVFELEGQMEVHLEVSDMDHGYIHINTIGINPGTVGVPEEFSPWSGVYFKGLPIELEAIPYEGYMFSHWEGDTDALEAAFTAAYSLDSIGFKAIFITDTVTPLTTVHYWNFNSLSEPFNTVLPDSTLIGNAELSYPGNGEGFMDLVGEGSQINTYFDSPAGSALRARNPSNTRELLLKVPTTGYSDIHFSYVTKRTLNGAEFQQVEYQLEEDGPWTSLGLKTVILNYKLISFDLTDVPGVEDNGDFVIRILFSGESAQEEEGNNRFDNIAVSGLPVPLVNALSEHQGQEDNISLFPNPADASSTLTIQVKEGGIFHIDLYSVLGEKVEEVFEGYIPANMLWRIDHDLKDHPDGFYFYRVLSGADVWTREVILSH